MNRILTILAAIFCLCGCEKFFTPASIAKDSFNGEGWEMTLTAEKNTTGKRRTLYVGGMHGNLASSMRVTQK